MQIVAQMRRNVIPQLKPILNTSKLEIEMQFQMKLYIFLSVQQLRQIAATLKRKLRWETGLLNTSLLEMRPLLLQVGQLHVRLVVRQLLLQCEKKKGSDVSNLCPRSC